MVERKYDSIVLSFEKFLSQLAIETPTVRYSFAHKYKYVVESCKHNFANYYKH